MIDSGSEANDCLKKFLVNFQERFGCRRVPLPTKLRSRVDCNGEGSYFA